MQSFKTENVNSSRILIVDDQEANVRLLEMILSVAGFLEHADTTDPRQVMPLYESYQPDLILLDLQMPHMDGYAVMEQLTAALPPDTYLPILVLTGDISPATKKRALAAGADDFLSKPLDTSEVVLRIRNLLQIRHLHDQLRKQNQTLDARVRERTEQLIEAQLEIFNRLAIAAEYRDDATGEHTQRVGNLSAIIARGLGQTPEQVELLRLASTLHDVGKIGLPDRVLLKEGSLSGGEFEIVKSHTQIGAEILGRSKFAMMQMAREIALSHHERWDGSGYPLRLKGEQIPLCGRIVAIADVFDALTHNRPYKEAWRMEDAVAEIKKQSGRQFDPQLVDVFLSFIKAEGLRNLSEHILKSSGDPKISVSVA